MSLSSFNVRKQLQIANFFSAYKSYGFIENEKKGGTTPDADIKKMRVLNALAASIYDYGTIYVQPSFTFTLDIARSNAVLSMTFGSAVYDPLTIKSNSIIYGAQEISDYINSQNIGFTAVNNHNYITVYAVNGSESNGIAASIQITNGAALGIPFPTVFSSDGSDYFSENTDRTLTDEQVYTIIDKMNMLIDEPCDKFLNF